MFRPALEEVLVKKDCKTPAGRPQIDVVLMFKVIFLQRYFGFGDHQIQYQIIDHTSFRQFLGIHTVAEVPDEKTKLIEKYHTTNASVHDSNVIEPLIEEKDKGQDLFLDAGYESKEDIVRECGMNPVICEKRHRNNSLTDEQKQNNRIKSKDRCRII